MTTQHTPFPAVKVCPLRDAACNEVPLSARCRECFSLPASAGAMSAVQPATVDALPPLPHPDIQVTAFGEIVPTDRRPFVMGGFFSADQMRKYALASPPAPTPAVPVEAKQEPLFWYRPVGTDGGYEGPVHHNSVGGKMLRDEKPGEWFPLFASPTAGTPAPAVPTEQTGFLEPGPEYWAASEKVPAAPAAPAPLAELAGAAKVLVDFARTAPGRLPSRVQEAISAIEREVRSTSPSVTHSGRIES